mmetsp:Transcript_32732/g.82096  ORF Transcript_32732/g.82096 Transcript_32732/m.82096 type:complete len:236 (+) Transcript_32732:242-949(+)
MAVIRHRQVCLQERGHCPLVGTGQGQGGGQGAEPLGGAGQRVRGVPVGGGVIPCERAAAVRLQHRLEQALACGGAEPGVTAERYLQHCLHRILRAGAGKRPGTLRSIRQRLGRVGALLKLRPHSRGSGITAAIGDSAGHHGGYNLHLAILQRGPGVEVHQNAVALLSSRGPQPAARGQAENRDRREPPRHAVPAAKLRRRGGVARLLWERSQSSLNQWSQHALVQCCLQLLIAKR